LIAAIERRLERGPGNKAAPAAASGPRR